MEGKTVNPNFFRRWASRPKTIVFALCFTAAIIPAACWSIQLWRTVEARLRQGPFSNTLSLYAAPHTLTVGDAIDPAQLGAELRQAGIRSRPKIQPDTTVWIGTSSKSHPGPQSYFRAEPARIHFRDGRLSEIVLINGGGKSEQYNLEPQLIVDLNDDEREKRRFVHFDQIPPGACECGPIGGGQAFLPSSGHRSCASRESCVCERQIRPEGARWVNAHHATCAKPMVGCPKELEAQSNRVRNYLDPGGRSSQRKRSLSIIPTRSTWASRT